MHVLCVRWSCVCVFTFVYVFSFTFVYVFAFVFVFTFACACVKVYCNYSSLERSLIPPPNTFPPLLVMLSIAASVVQRVSSAGVT